MIYKNSSTHARGYEKGSFVSKRNWVPQLFHTKVGSGGVLTPPLTEGAGYNQGKTSPYHHTKNQCLFYNDKQEQNKIC